MKSRILILTLALDIFVLAGATAFGDTFYSRNGGGNWNNTSAWSLSDCTGGQPPAGDFPQAGDDAIVCGGDLIDVNTNSTVDSLRIDDGEVDTGAFDLTITDAAGLTIAANELLDVSGAGGVTLSGGGTHTVNGRIDLVAANSDLTISGSDATISGIGEVDGQNDGALISIASGKKLTSALNTAGTGITGALQITGDGSFTNNGIVNANDGSAASRDTLLIDVGGTLADGNNANRWRVAADAAVLQFASTIGTLSELDGNFVMTSGNSSSKIIFDHTLTTNGKLVMSVGVVDVNENVTMGKDDPSGVFLDMSGGLVDVEPGDTFTHK